MFSSLKKLSRAYFHFASIYVASNLFAALAQAADVAKPAPAVPLNLLNLILGVVFLLLLVGGAWWLLRRMGGMQWPAQRAAMKVLASLPVGPRERVVLIEIAGQQWLLGVAPGQVSLLQKFDEPVITAGGNDEFASRMRQILQNSLGRS